VSDVDLSIIPPDLPSEVERAIRRHERQRLRRLLDGDIRRFAHAMAAVLADPAVDRVDRQKMARLFTDEQRRFLRALLAGDARRMALFLAAVVEQVDREDP
jgi:hypothetical protein